MEPECRGKYLVSSPATCVPGEEISCPRSSAFPQRGAPEQRGPAPNSNASRSTGGARPRKDVECIIPRRRGRWAAGKEAGRGGAGRLQKTEQHRCGNLSDPAGNGAGEGRKNGILANFWHFYPATVPGGRSDWVFPEEIFSETKIFLETLFLQIEIFLI